MRKTLAILMSLFALAYVGLAYADEDEGGDRQRNIWRQEREDDKSEREQRKNEWEQKREGWKTEREQALENLKSEKARLRTAFKEKLEKNRCNRIEAKIQARTAKFGSDKVKHMSAYTNLQNRIQKFINRFDAFYKANPDKGEPSKLAELKADFGTSANMTSGTLNGLIYIFKQSLTELSSKLGTTRKTTCVSTEGDLRATLADAKVALKTVHNNAAAIRTFVREQILPDLLAVKKDIASIRGEADDEDKNENEDQGDEDKDSDITLPTVSITAPADGTPYVIATTVNITASAADNDEVEKVEFYDGGVLKGTDEEAPYSYDWVITAAETAGAHSWTVKAYDDAGNTAVSSAVNLTVAIPAPTP